MTPRAQLRPEGAAEGGARDICFTYFESRPFFLTCEKGPFICSQISTIEIFTEQSFHKGHKLPPVGPVGSFVPMHPARAVQMGRQGSRGERGSGRQMGRPVHGPNDLFGGTKTRQSFEACLVLLWNC